MGREFLCVTAYNTKHFCNLLNVCLTRASQALFKFTRTANVSAYLWVLASGVIANFVVANLVNNVNTDAGALFGIQLIPPFALFRGLNDLAEYAFQANYQGIYGMKWSNITDPRNGIADCYAILFVEGVLFLLAAAYLQVQQCLCVRGDRDLAV